MTTTTLKAGDRVRTLAHGVTSTGTIVRVERRPHGLDYLVQTAEQRRAERPGRWYAAEELELA